MRPNLSERIGPGAALLWALLRHEPIDDLPGAAGADPNGAFCAGVTRGPAAEAQPGTWSAVLSDGSLTWVLAQTEDPALVVHALSAPAGVGGVRVGWAGARESLLDARLALGIARDDVACFADDWVLATVFSSRGRLSEVCASGVAVAQSSGHLADAVQAFADHRLSVVGAARALHVHPNTVIYRLERWRGLTGWDPRTFRGLAASVACLRAAT